MNAYEDGVVGAEALDRHFSESEAVGGVTYTCEVDRLFMARFDDNSSSEVNSEIQALQPKGSNRRDQKHAVDCEGNDPVANEVELCIVR